jgi:hypothetical protein
MPRVAVATGRMPLYSLTVVVAGQHRHQGIHAAGSLRAAIRSTVRSPTAPIRESALMIVQVESSAAIPDVKYGNITLNVDTEQQF